MSLDLEILKENVGVQPEAVAGSTARPVELTEFDYANQLAEKLPPIKTVGSDWFAYSEGAWQKIHRATLRPKAQAILPEHTAKGFDR